VYARVCVVVCERVVGGDDDWISRSDQPIDRSDRLNRDCSFSIAQRDTSPAVILIGLTCRKRCAASASTSPFLRLLLLQVLVVVSDPGGDGPLKKSSRNAPSTSPSSASIIESIDRSRSMQLLRLLL
jgi:hypothetical protein